MNRLRVPRPRSLPFAAQARRVFSRTMSRRVLVALLILLLSALSPTVQAAPPEDNPNPPDTAVRLIFVHHSTGGNWLADAGEHEFAGGLGRTLMENNYYVSATNYGWGPDSIGDRTDIPNWPEWFTGPRRDTILEALYTEDGQNFGDYGAWPRLDDDPGGENQIIVFKSCFPNSNLYGAPDDPPAESVDDSYTVANAKAVYLDLLTYFATRQDKLFVVITAPPLADFETEPDLAANARAFNNWLVNDWLADYPHANVAVFDFYNVLTSSAGSPERHDLDAESGNHHRWWNGSVQHVQGKKNNFSAYYTGDSHPSGAGGQKAAAEFAPLLNMYYHRWQHSLTAMENAPPAAVAVAAPDVGAAALVGPIRLAYQGAFRLPDDGERPRTFAYGGAAMTFNPDGDRAGPDDGFPGSLFVMGHDRLPYGELPDGSQIAEIDIPVPTRQTTPSALHQATFLQYFTDVAAGYFTGLDELPRAGMLYLNTPATGPKVHLSWGQHLQPDPAPEIWVGPHTWFNPDLAAPALRGPWTLGDLSPYAVGGYLLEIPAGWADRYAGGRYVGSGRFRDGGWSGMGPALFAYRPWRDDAGTPAPAGARLEEITLLHYESAEVNPHIERRLNGYQHPDEWEGGAWLTTPDGRAALLFAGTKSVGAKYWYGFVNPAGPDEPCVEGEMVAQFTVCRLADGSPCEAADLVECADHNDYRGWWSTAMQAQFILYDPADLARVAEGAMQPWEPQPFATLVIDEVLFDNPSGVEADMLGGGPQRRYRIGDVACDRANGLLYVLELFADEAKPVVHVWKVE